MGGCRCSYRNCTVRTDGKTHLFHYPVFEKFRCHQWLKNANKLHFLDLKVSQLKNRVVCQHHFTDDNFMNFKRDRLKHDAIPTENGPFCNETVPGVDKELKIQNFSIIPEDIDVNDELTLREKRANLKVKYADFLTSTDPEIQTMITLIDDPVDFKGEAENFIDKTKDDLFEVRKSSNKRIISKLPPKGPKIHTVKQPKTVSPLPFAELKTRSKAKPSSESNKTSDQVSDVLATCTDKKQNNKIRILSEKKIARPIKFTGILEPVQPNILLHPRYKAEEPIKAEILEESVSKEKDIPLSEVLTFLSPSNSDLLHQQLRLQPHVEIVNPEYVSEFAPVTGDLVSKPVLLEAQHLQNQNTEVFLQGLPENMPIIPIEHLNSLSPVNKEQNQTSLEPLTRNKMKEMKFESNFALQDKNTQKVYDDTSLTVFSHKPKIPPERVAAIEQKRKFNKKLRDMIEFCLDEVDDPSKLGENGKDKIVAIEKDQLFKVHVAKPPTPHRVADKPKPHVSPKIIQKQKSLLDTSTKEKTSLLAQSPTKEDSVISSLENRLRRMEDLLLQKISQNTEKIVDLQKSLDPPENFKKSSHTQTSTNEEQRKKQLYQEISQYLSPDVNSLVYEELFLNKYVKRKSEENKYGKKKSEEEKVKVQTPPTKRRRRRY